jgi:hypothetical protein
MTSAQASGACGVMKRCTWFVIKQYAWIEQSKRPAKLAQVSQISEMVVFGEKTVAAVMPALDNVQANVGDDDPRQSRHNAENGAVAMVVDR